MIGIPFGIRPPQQKAHIQGRQEHKKTQEHSQDGFSDMLTALLMLVMKDGLASRSLITMLRDVYPYAQPEDRRQIERLLCAKDRAESLKTSQRFPNYAALIEKPPLSRTDRLIGMMSVLRKYAAKDTEDLFCMLERIINMSRMMQGGAADPMGMITQMLPKGSLGDMAGMMEMIKRMS